VASFGARWADGSRTPSHDSGPSGLRTPLRADGFRTPMHDSFGGSQTPMHDGSRTPMHMGAFGSQTPLHDSFAPGTPMHDGSRTPLHGTSVWDPAARTPAHRPETPKYEDSFASEWANMGGSGSQSPFHSGQAAGKGADLMDAGYGTFMGGLGGGLASNPFLDTGNPFAMSSDASPFGNSTPIGSDFGKLPSIAGSSSTNVGSSQWTPTSPAGSTNPNASPFPAHGGAGGNDEPTLPDNIRVKLLTDGRQGTIAEVDGASYGIEVEPGEPLIKVRREEIEVVRPAKKDRLVIIKGELRGHTGTLIGIDGTDGIVKMTTNSDIKILDLKSCAKLADVLG
jgi:transcription elongation factor SPT5